MTQTSTESGSAALDRSGAVALITLSRYLASKDAAFLPYLAGSLDHAIEAGLSDGDLAGLRLIIGALGG